MQKIPVVKDGEGIAALDLTKYPNVARVVCDGKFHHVYDHGEAIPAEHSHEAMMSAGNAAPKKPKAAKKPH